MQCAPGPVAAVKNRAHAHMLGRGQPSGGRTGVPLGTGVRRSGTGGQAGPASLHRAEAPGVVRGGEAGPAQGPPQAAGLHGASGAQESKRCAAFVSRV